MEQVLITVVIPIYKVEDYLDECVQSVRNQTYQNLEIILVDDGSPDNCPAMCDRYAQEDSRIKVIHKENGGLSDARNAGIDIATGKYITFVDSDDYIHEEMVEKLYTNIIKHNADISMCTNYRVSDDGEKIKYDLCPDKLTGTTDIEKYRIMFYKGWEAWAKLYKITLFAEARYPKGVLYEDFALTPKLFMKAEIITYSPDGLYYYRMRDDSIMRKIPQSKADLVNNAEDNIEFFINNNAEEATILYVFKFIKKELNNKRALADKSTDIGRDYIAAFEHFENKYNGYIKKTHTSYRLYPLYRIGLKIINRLKIIKNKIKT